MTLPVVRPEVLALLADVKDHPHQDVLRLILADWLDDHGTDLDRARAELVRAQVEYARLPAAEPTRNEYARRARILQQRHGVHWLGPLAGWPTSWTSKRGLLSLDLAITSLRSQKLLAQADSEPWAWVEAVHLLGAGDENLARLAGCSLLEGPIVLGLQNSQIGPAGAQALARMPWLRRYIQLDLGAQMLEARGLAVLLNSDHLVRLRRLDLPAGALDVAGASVLASSRIAGALQTLVLWGTHLGDVGLRALLAPATLSGLLDLDLRSNVIGDPGSRALADCPALAGLRRLDLTDNRIGPEGAAALARSPHLDAIDTLVLWGNPVGIPGARLLQERFGNRVSVTPVAG